MGARDELSANRDNPVVVGNAALIAIAAIGLGVGAYRKHAKGELNWGLVGTWAGVVGLFATGDYFLSQYVFASWRFSLQQVFSLPAGRQPKRYNANQSVRLTDISSRTNTPRNRRRVQISRAANTSPFPLPCIHLSLGERSGGEQRLAEKLYSISFCPSSPLFLLYSVRRNIPTPQLLLFFSYVLSSSLSTSGTMQVQLGFPGRLMASLCLGILLNFFFFHF